MKEPKTERDVFSDVLIGAALVLTLAILIATLFTDDAKGTTAAPRPPMSTAHASCYRLFGNSTANGTIITPQTIGVANKTLPFGTRVWIKANGHSIVAKVIDRGPFVAGRTFDLTHGAVRHLGFSSCEAFGHRDVKYLVMRRR